MYNVVFEYSAKAGGFAGIRFTIPYSNKAAFERRLDTDGMDKVIAENVTVEEAERLYCAIPEVCRLTAAVEDICTAKGNINALSISQFLDQAVNIILNDRERRAKHNILVPLSYPFADIPSKDTAKNAALRFVKKRYHHGSGFLGDLGTMRAEMHIELIKLHRKYR